MKRTTRTLTVLAAVAGVAALGAIAPAAQASYFTGTQLTGVCQGANDLHAIGASGLREAQIVWGNNILTPSPFAQLGSGFGYDAGADFAACQVYRKPADGGTKQLDYKATGSGSCVTGILGTTGPRSFTPAGEPTVTNVAYCGTEDAPTEAQLTAAEGGAGATPSHPAEANFMTIPVAQLAIAVNMRLPDGCRVNADKRNLLRDEVESAFEGTIDTWGELFQGGDMYSDSGTPADNAACRNKVFARVVRKDASGTTFVFKRYLQAVTDLPGGSSFDWRQPSIGGTLANNAWPAGQTTVLTGDLNGTPSALDKLAAQGVNGGIGYGDVGASRGQDIVPDPGPSRKFAWDFVSGAFTSTDTSVWAKVQRITNDSFNSPGISNAQVTSGANLGAACVNVAYTGAPTTNLGASWSDTTAIPTPTDYPICGLNYFVTSLWGLDVNPTPDQTVWAGLNQGEYRGMKDYMRYVLGIIRTGVGPGKLAEAGYSQLPVSIRSTARCAVTKLGYVRASGDPAPASPISRGATDPVACPAP